MAQDTKFHKVVLLTLCLAALALSSLASPSYASLITGTDWNGMDLVPSNGDILSGVFTDVRLFQISAGDIVAFGPQLDIFANSISIYGTLDGPASSDSTLSLDSSTSIYLDSSSSIIMYGNGNSLYLVAGETVVLNGYINIQADQQQNAVPLPSSVILFGPVVAGFGLLRKKLRYGEK